MTTPTLADIQTTDLLYFDPAFAAQAAAFCAARDIDCLPSLDNPSRFYRLNRAAQRFEPRPLTGARCVAAGQVLFQPALLERFRRHAVLFVFEHGALTGVVHFSDYNRPVVSDHLYTRLSAYERALRTLAQRSGLGDADMGHYFETKVERTSGREKKRFERRLNHFERRSADPSIPPFQRDYLDDLIGLLAHHDVIQLQQKPAVDLRNAIMHAHDPVNMTDVTTPDYIFDFATFETFFSNARALLDDARRVENQLRFMDPPLSEQPAQPEGDR